MGLDVNKMKNKIEIVILRFLYSMLPRLVNSSLNGYLISNVTSEKSIRRIGSQLEAFIF